MFTVEIAGIPIGIDNNYGLAEIICAPFITDQPPLFTVSVAWEELLREEGGPSANAELLCIHRRIAMLLPDYDAFLMHAAVIDIGGCGLAFTAPSGTGKTTRVLMWQKTMGDRVKVVNGDKPVLRFIDGKVYAFGTPWMGKEQMGVNTSVPLEYVCFLEHSENVSLTQLPPDQVIPRLLRQTMIPKDREQMEHFLQLLERFVYEATFFLLKCNQDKEDPVKLWNQMEGIRHSKRIR